MRTTRVVLSAAALIGLGALGFGLWASAQLRGSLPQLDGSRALAGLSSPVTVTRDALGVPTIAGATREDVARATGFLHAQERFFQMDLSRRRAAGELAALVGARALVADVPIRMHRFRAEAERAASLMTTADRALLEAYTAGVNEGLAALARPPFEYLLLGQTPERWRLEDSLLVVLAMFITLQDADASFEATLGTMHDVLPPQMAAFLASPGTEWDAPIVGERFRVPGIPGPEVYDLRTRRTGKRPIEVPARPELVRRPATNSRFPTSIASSLGVGNRELGIEGREAVVGSNNWVVSGALTADGRPLLANDMHLLVRVPNTWYRAALEWADPANPSEPRRLVGLTLPGYPSLVTGSNTHVAWGFTNTYADWSDIVLLDVAPGYPVRYRTPDGWRELERHDEVIKVAGEADREVRIEWTIWGPVLGPDHRGRLRALRWVAHSAEQLAAAGRPLEDARSIEEAFASANGIGTPGQNLVVAARDGHIGWSIYGSIPRRVGLDGRLPASWADGTARWDGWLADEEYPRVVDPPDGRIWTANARVADGDMLARLGDGSYEVGSRATIIRDRLFARSGFTPRDMLDIQLDTSGRFLSRWRDLILDTLTAEATGNRRSRARFRDLVSRTWTGEASPDSVAYRFTRMFREQVSDRVMTFVLAECYEADPAFDHTTMRRREGPLWKLVTEQPMHLLDPRYASWDELLGDAVDAVIERVTEDGDMAARTWSEYNVTAYRHPLSASLPIVDRWLDMPLQRLPGDLFTPRMHWGGNGASQRMVVSPGREAEGIMHMPTGQSGHPLSPFYANSHEAWVRGEATPLLPGATVHTLTLVP